MSRNFCKILICAGASVILSALLLGQAVGSQIAELKLVNGKTFTGATVVRLDRDKAVFRNAAGPFPLTYSTIAEPMRTALLAARDGAAATPKADASTPSAQPQQRVTISGTVFSAGMDQPYKFANLRVVVVPAANAKEIDASTFELGRFETIAGETKTDIDGKFSVQVPPGEYVVYARTLRSYRNGTRTPFGWRIPVSASEATTIDLTDSNMTLPDTVIERVRRY